MTKPALLKPRGLKVIWLCPSCRRTLGEIYEGTVIVKWDDRILTFPQSAPVHQVCPNCATESLIQVEAA